VVSLSQSPLAEHGRECLDYIRSKPVGPPGLHARHDAPRPEGIVLPTYPMLDAHSHADERSRGGHLRTYVGGPNPMGGWGV
jgi:hypothetical protein